MAEMKNNTVLVAFQVFILGNVAKLIFLNVKIFLALNEQKPKQIKLTLNFDSFQLPCSFSWQNGECKITNKNELDCNSCNCKNSDVTLKI